MLQSSIYLTEETFLVKKHKLLTIRPMGFLGRTETCFYSNTSVGVSITQDDSHTRGETLL